MSLSASLTSSNEGLTHLFNHALDVSSTILVTGLKKNK